MKTTTLTLASDRPTEWLTAQELAAELRIPLSTLYRWRVHKQGPIGHIFGKHLRFSRESVNAWLEQQADPERSA